MFCSGMYELAGTRFRCHGYHEKTDLLEAIQKSCDVYFYQVGIQLGMKALVEYGTRVGFGQITGIDLPGEKSGTYPDSVGWWQENLGYPAVTRNQVGEGEAYYIAADLFAAYHRSQYPGLRRPLRLPETNPA